MTTHTIIRREPVATALCVQAINVRADRVRPGDLLLRPTDGPTVRVCTVENAIPDRLKAHRVNIHLHNAPSLHLHRQDTVTVMRAM